MTVNKYNLTPSNPINGKSFLFFLIQFLCLSCTSNPDPLSCLLVVFQTTSYLSWLQLVKRNTYNEIIEMCSSWDLILLRSKYENLCFKDRIVKNLFFLPECHYSKKINPNLGSSPEQNIPKSGKSKSPHFKMFRFPPNSNGLKQ